MNTVALIIGLVLHALAMFDMLKNFRARATGILHTIGYCTTLYRTSMIFPIEIAGAA